MNKLDHAGIEVSSEELLVELCRDGKALKLRRFPNTISGHSKICQFLAMKKDRVVRVVMESTGVYGLDLAIELYYKPGIEVMVANPRAVRRYAEATMKRSKNDEIDVHVLLEFARTMPFRPYTAPSERALGLRTIARRICAINKQVTRERNRLHAAGRTRTTPEAVVVDLQATLSHYDQSIESLTDEAMRLIQMDPRLAHEFSLMISVKGIAKASAIQILSELAVLPDDLDPRQLTALAGLDPVQHKSGKSVDKPARISKQGNKYLRSALYMPALVAIRYEPNVKAFYQHLIAEGKKKMQAVIAVMRKLLHAIWGMFKNDQTFDGSKFYTIPETTQ